jgi:hypothetical protein
MKTRDIHDDVVTMFEEAAYERGYGSSSEDMNDWSDGFDDRDADDWEHHYEPESWGIEYSDLPEDESAEEDKSKEVYENDEYDEAHSICEQQEMGGQENYSGVLKIMRMPSERQTNIVEWLADSQLAEPLEKSETGFLVRKGQPVKLIDGSVVEASSWLIEEGINDGLLVSGYYVTVTKNSADAEPEILRFEKRTIIDAPLGWKRRRSLRQSQQMMISHYNCA